MATKIFVNMAVKNLQKTKVFFKKLGYKFNPQFTDKKAACLVISKDIYVMLLAEKFFKAFLIKKKMADARKSTEMLLAVTAKNRKAVDRLFDKAIAAGAKMTRPAEDYGWMYSRPFEDLDGHNWEIFWMDPTRIKKTPGEK